MKTLVLKLEDHHHEEIARQLQAIALYTGKSVEEQVLRYLAMCPIRLDMQNAIRQMEKWAEGAEWTEFP